MTTPTITPTPAPLPNRSQGETDFNNSVESYMTWLEANADELALFIDWVVQSRDDVIAAALAGNLPDLTGQALRFLQVNAAEDGVELAYFDNNNVKNFGAVGDGVSDDSLAFNQALLGGNVRLFVPSGTYRLDSYVRLYANTEIILEQNAVIVHNAPTSALFMNGEFGNSTYALSYNGESNIYIQGGIFDCSPKVAASEISEPFAFAHAENITLDRCVFRNNYNDHFVEYNAIRNGKILNCIFEDTTLLTPDSRESVNIDYSTAAGFPHFGGYDGTVCDNILIQGCVFKNGDVAVGSHSDPTPLIHNNIVVSDCTIDGMFSWGLDSRYWNLANSRVDRTEITNMNTATREYRGTVRADGRYLIYFDDNEAEIIPIPRPFPTEDPQSTFMISGWSNSSSAPKGLYWGRSTAAPVLQEVAVRAAADVNLLTGVLTGSTGPDGDFNMSVASDGNLYLENRRGGAFRCDIAFISS